MVWAAILCINTAENALIIVWQRHMILSSAKADRSVHRDSAQNKTLSAIPTCLNVQFHGRGFGEQRCLVPDLQLAAFAV